MWGNESEKWRKMAEVDNNDFSEFSLHVFFSLINVVQHVKITWLKG